MALRSLNNPIASFIDYLAKTGTDAAAVPFSVSGGTEYVYDGKRIHSFTASGSLVVTGSGSVDVILIGGGGGSGGAPGGAGSGGGGAGGYVFSTK